MIYHLFEQFVCVGEDDDGEIPAPRDPREGRSLWGRGQDERRAVLLLFVQVGLTQTCTFTCEGSNQPRWCSSAGRAMMLKYLSSISHLSFKFI